MFSSRIKQGSGPRWRYGLRLLFLVALLLAAYAVLLLYQACNDRVVEQAIIDIRYPSYGELLSYVGSKVPPDILAGFDSGFAVQLTDPDVLSEVLLIQPADVEFAQDRLTDYGVELYLTLDQVLTLLKDESVKWISPAASTREAPSQSD